MAESDKVDILLVEDSSIDAALFLNALNNYHLAGKVLWVKDGESALDFIFSNGSFKDRDTSGQPKVILLDLKLPGISGIEVIRRIKSDEKTRDIPIIVLTISNEERDMLESYQLGVSSYVTKPLKFDNLMKLLIDLELYSIIFDKPFSTQ